MRCPPILAAALLGIVATAAAAEAPASVNVKYSDLDLSTAAGQAQLERRIDKAARSVCGVDDVITGSRVPSNEARLCLEETRARVHAQVAQAISREGTRG